MKLSTIIELKFGKTRKKTTPLLQQMPKSKEKHSVRVAKSLHKAGASDEAIHAGFLHDYLERGGSIDDLHKHVNKLGLPQTVLMAVQSLSSDEKNAEDVYNEPLRHLESIVQALDDQDLIDIVLLTKLADRVDNLTKRARGGRKIGRGYCDKSWELFRYIRQYYKGENKPFRRLSQRMTKLLKSCKK